MIETSYLYHNIKQLQFSEETKKNTCDPQDWWPISLFNSYWF